jgi:uncharacterized protein (TIGR02266 family)
MEDRRHETRIITDVVIMASKPALNSDARIVNLSTTGAFIKTAHPLDADSPLYIEIRLPNSSERISMNAHVIWAKMHSKTTCPGMGIEFTDIQEQHRKKLADFIKQVIRPSGG